MSWGRSGNIGQKHEKRSEIMLWSFSGIMIRVTGRVEAAFCDQYLAGGDVTDELEYIKTATQFCAFENVVMEGISQSND